MNAADFFKPADLLDLEKALFTESKEVMKYCLIQKSQKYFYIGTTVHVSNVIKRIRSVLFNVELDVVAHNLQKTVRATNLADWTIAVFKDPDFPDHYIRSKMQGYTELHKASRYEVHAMENIKVYLLEHRRYGVQTYMSSAIDLTETQFNSRARKMLRTRSEYFKDMDLIGKYKDLYADVAKAALHSGTGDWIIKEVSLPGVAMSDIPVWVRNKNELFLDLSYRVR